MKKPLSEVILHMDEVRLAREFIRKYEHAVRYHDGDWYCYTGMVTKTLTQCTGRSAGLVLRLMQQLLDDLCREDDAWLALRTKKSIEGALSMCAWVEPPEGLIAPLFAKWPERADRRQSVFSPRVSMLTAEREGS